MTNKDLPATARRLAAACVLAAAGGAAAAEAPAAFQDWELACRPGCVLATAVRGAGGRAAVRMSLPAGGREVVVTTPLPLYLPEPLVLVVGDGEPRTIPWHTCGAAGCEARVAFEGGLRAALRREREATVGFTLVDGERVRVAVSLMGFTAGERALDAAAGD